jgi:hypothetical protein
MTTGRNSNPARCGLASLEDFTEYKHIALSPGSVGAMN